MEWTTEGQQPEIVKKGNVITRRSRPPRRKSTKIEVPDFAVRQQRIFGDKVLPGNSVADDRESYEW